MNCREFESTFNEIAREALTDAVRRERAEAHAAECQPCAAHFSDARALTAGLRALSTGASDAGAPPRVEANLLAAFRAQAAEHASIVTPAPPARVAGATVVPLTVKKWSWPKTFGAAGMAAAAAVAIVLVPAMFFGPGTKQASSPALIEQAKTTSVETTPSIKTVAPPDVITQSAPMDEGEEKFQPLPPRYVPPSQPSNRGLMTNAGFERTRRGGNIRPPAPLPVSNTRPEIVTDFIPLTQGGGFGAGESAHVVRVELPRTALARFGLPVNAESEAGRVKADVLVGEDGVARAIRFVR